jgi:hypothetical protein
MKNQKKIFEIKIPSWYGSITLLFKNIRGLKKLPINVSKHKFKSSYKAVIYQVYKENWGKQMLKHSEGNMLLENVSHHLSHKICNRGKVCLVGEHPDITLSQFVICVMKYET